MKSEAQREAMKRYFKTPRGKEALHRCHLKAKLEVIEHYGGGKLACVKCGFSDIRALSIDHIKAVGQKRMNSGYFYHWLRKNNYPEGCQTLCMNCQWIKRAEQREYIP